MKPSINLRSLRLTGLAALLSCSAFWSGCSTLGTADLAKVQMPLAAIAANSPAPEIATPVQALEGAEAYVQQHPGSNYLVGNGNSMLPLYQDGAVVVTEHPDLSQVKIGQTVVFTGRNGEPVAHVAIRNTPKGWVTMGLGNCAADAGTVTEDNYIGVVVKAYQPTGSAVLAYVPAAQQQMYASNP